MLESSNNHIRGDSMIYLYQGINRLGTPFFKKRAGGWPSLFILQLLYRNINKDGKKIMATSTILIAAMIVLIGIIIFQFYWLFRIFQWIHFINSVMSELCKILINHTDNISKNTQINQVINEFIKKEMSKQSGATIN